MAAPTITIRAETSTNALPFSLVQCSLDISRYYYVDTTAFSWTASGSGTGEYYLRTAANANPATALGAAGTITDIRAWQQTASGNHRVQMRRGTLGALAAWGFAFGDNDSLGYNTLYVRCDDDASPASGEIALAFDECSTGDSCRWEECEIEWWLDQEHAGTATALASWSGTTRYVTDPRDGTTQIDLAGVAPTATAGSPIKGPIWSACLPAGSYQIKCRVTNKSREATTATTTFTVNAESRGTPAIVDSGGTGDYPSVAAAAAASETLIEVKGGHTETVSAILQFALDDTYVYWDGTGDRPVFTSSGNFYWSTRFNGVTIRGLKMVASTANTGQVFRFLGNATSGATNCACVDIIGDADEATDEWAKGFFVDAASSTGQSNGVRRIGLFNCETVDESVASYYFNLQNAGVNCRDIFIAGGTCGTSPDESCIRQTNACYRFSLLYTDLHEDEKDCLRLVQGECNWVYGNKMLDGAIRVGATATVYDQTSRGRIEANLLDRDTAIASGLSCISLREGVRDYFVCNNVADVEVSVEGVSGTAAPGIAATVKYDSTVISFTAPDTITLGSGSWDNTPAGGTTIYIEGSASNDGAYTVSSSTASTINVGSGIVNESQGASVSIGRAEMTVYAGYQGHENIVIVHNTIDEETDLQAAMTGGGSGITEFITACVMSNNLAGVDTDYDAFAENAYTAANNADLVAALGADYRIAGASALTTYAGVLHDYAGTRRGTTSAAGAVAFAAPTISAVSPDSVAVGATGTLTVTGTGFVDGAVLSADAGMTLGATTFNSSTELECGYTATAAGTTTITATNPDDQADTGTVTVTAKASGAIGAFRMNVRSRRGI